MKVDLDDLDDQMRRLVLGRWLTRRAGEAVGGVVPAETSPENIEELAARLGKVVADGPPPAGARFEPTYPGSLAEDVTGRGSLVLECAVEVGGEPLGVVLTVLIPGRRPEVSIAPPSARARGGKD